MGATVLIVWPDASEADLDAQPGFFNDCKAWGSFMAARERAVDVLGLFETLELKALLTFRTDGMTDEHVAWVTPEALAAAATSLRTRLVARDPIVAPIVATYALDANHVDPVDDELAQDLADIATLAAWARERGATRVTLDVNW